MNTDPLTLTALMGLVLFGAVEAVPALMARRRRAPGELLSTVLIVLCGLVWLLSLLDRHIHLTTLGNHLPTRLTGLALFFSGILVRLVSFVTLGRFYNFNIRIEKDHRLIRHGIYGRIRHPLYLGTLLVFLGFPIATDSLAGLIAFGVLCIPALTLRIHREERLLLEAFPYDYREYSRSTGRLFPRLFGH